MATRLLPCSILALALALAGAASAQNRRVGQRAAAVLDHPCPAAGSYYGHAVAALDLDGTGGLEVAVGAFGQGAVYVHHDVSLSGHGPATVLQAGGPVGCPPLPAADQFGYALAAGNLDGDPQDELVVGAPHTSIGPVIHAGQVQIFRYPGDSAPILLRSLDPGPDRFGGSVAVGDFDGDGRGDVAVSAPKTEVGGAAAGAVHVFFGPFDVVPPVLVIANPQPVEHGNFGHHLAVGDFDLDGVHDLVVSAIGNANSAGLPVAGQVYVYPGPIDPARRLLIEDPVPDPGDLPGPRYGMHVAAREDWVAVGANRKDWNAVHDAGLGFSARGALVSPVTLHPFPDPSPSDYLGFRCVVADVVGDSALDLTFAMMPKQTGPGIDPYALVTWDGNDPLGPPAMIRPALPRSGDHFANGLVAAQVVPGGRDELVVGDGTFDPAGTGGGNDTGRVVIYAYQ